ncbi:ThiF family adenylyltransferase [Paenibacillus sp. 843]|uniref:ThiF family adenylyltransferase n=1 Tax=Paenibacillus sp. 843 TaxID=3341795 RepID=UPI00372BCF94
MVARPNLKEYYDGVLEQAALHLKHTHEAVEVPSPYKDNPKYVKFLQIEKVIEIKCFTFILCLPFNFPDEFPSVFIMDPLFSELFPIPHLDRFQELCLFDKNEAHPNAEQPIELLDAVIERSFFLLNEGFTQQNDTDFIDEFESYWVQETKHKIYSLISPDGLSKEIYWLHFRKNDDELSLVSESLEEGQRWISQFDGKMQGKATKAWFQPLSSLGKPPFPTNNREMYRRLIEYGKITIKDLTSFLNRYARPSLIVFSIPYRNGYIMGAWTHAKNSKFRTTVFRGKHRLQDSLNGFRPGKRHAQLELNRDYGELAIDKYFVERVDAKRLFNRGGDGLTYHNPSIAMIGCGSIGSHLSQALVETGVRRVLLIDPDRLNFENIARHSCGASYVGKNKAHALKHSLGQHFPHLDITVRKQDILHTLIKETSLLNSFDLSIVALGSYAIEHRLSILLREGIISTTMLFVWVEPYVAGGHAIYADPSYPGCFNCLFDANRRYPRSVLYDTSQYSKREAGCQSSYTPYGVADLKRFIYDLNIFIDDIRANKVQKNMVYTWVGNVKVQQEQGRKIASRWKNTPSYSAWRVPIEEIGLCDKCEP